MDYDPIEREEDMERAYGLDADELDVVRSLGPAPEWMRGLFTLPTTSTDVAF